MAKADEKASQAQAQALAKAADKVKGVSDDLVKLAQKFGSAKDDKAKQKLIDEYDAALDDLAKLKKEQDGLMKQIIQNLQT